MCGKGGDCASSGLTYHLYLLIIKELLLRGSQRIVSPAYYKELFLLTIFIPARSSSSTWRQMEVIAKAGQGSDISIRQFYRTRNSICQFESYLLINVHKTHKSLSSQILRRKVNNLLLLFFGQQTQIRYYSRTTNS